MEKIYNFLGVSNLPELANIPEYNTAKKESRLKILGILAKASANLLRKMNLLSLLRVLKNDILTKILFKNRISNSLDQMTKCFLKILRFKKSRKTNKSKFIRLVYLSRINMNKKILCTIGPSSLNKKTLSDLEQIGCFLLGLI